MVHEGLHLILAEAVIEKLNGFYIYDDVGKPIKIEQASNKNTTAEEAKTKNGWLMKAALVLSLMIAIGSLIICFCFYRWFNKLAIRGITLRFYSL